MLHDSQGVLGGSSHGQDSRTLLSKQDCGGGAVLGPSSMAVDHPTTSTTASPASRVATI